MRQTSGKCQAPAPALQLIDGFANEGRTGRIADQTTGGGDIKLARSLHEEKCEFLFLYGKGIGFIP